MSRSFAGGTPSRANPEYYGAGIPWLKSGEVRAGRIEAIEEQITEKGLQESSSRVAKAGSPVIAMYGATAGVTGILGMDAALNQAVLAIEPKSDYLDGEFCYYLLDAEGKRLLAMTQGSGQPNLSKSLIVGLEILLPPLDEQRRIAEVLRSADDAIAIAGEAFDRARRTLQLSAEMLLVLDPELGGQERRLGDVIASLDAGVSVNSEGRPTTEGELGILKTSCVSQGVFDPKEHKAVLVNEEGRVRVQPTANSIIISRMNTIDLVGANAFVAHNHPSLFLPDRLWLLKTNSVVKCRWLAYYMKTARFRDQIADIASGTSGSMKNMSKARLAELPLYIPNVQRQDDAIQILSSIEEVAQSAWNVLQLHRRLRKALSSDLLSGRVRVPA